MIEQLSERAQRDRAHFDAIADAYYKKDRRPAHRAARILRLMQTLKNVPMSAETRILEVGCGAGFTAEYLKGMYGRFVGVDYSEKLIDHAVQFHNYPGTEFITADINAVEYDREFDIIVMIGLLHHLDDPAATLSRLKGWLKPSGVIAANEPQSGNRAISWLRNVRKKVDRSYSDEQLEFSKAEMIEIFERAGLSDIEVTPQGVFSTPFAEVAMPLQFLTAPVSRAACAADGFIEARFGQRLTPLAWNLAATGKAPV